MPNDPAESGQRDRIEEAELLGPGLIHEMRHPLMGIKAGLELISRRMGPTVTSLEDWEMITAQVARLEELFRSYQQLFTEQAHPLARFAVEPVVQRAVDLVAWRLRRLGARFEWTRSGPHHGMGTPNAVLHAVINLLVNAVDAVEEAGGAGRVAIRVLDGPLQIRISDEGSGIAEENTVHIFQPRFTTKPAGKGTGLGLHIARQAMTRAGGNVHLVPAADPHRLPWAKTEFAVEIAPGT